MCPLNLDRRTQARDEETPKTGESSAARVNRGKLLTALAMVALGVGFICYMWYIAHANLTRPGMGADGPPTTVTGGRLAARLSDMLSRSESADFGAAPEALRPMASGRWDPFKPLVEDPQVRPVQSSQGRDDSRASAETAQTAMAQRRTAPSPPAPGPVLIVPPEPPNTSVTGILRSDGRAIAIISSGGLASMVAVGDAPFPGAVVRAIDDSSVTLNYYGREFRYTLGGEPQ